MADYYTLITNTGKVKLATALATNTPIDLQDIAVGDGGGTVYNPTEAQTALANERYRAAINNIYNDPLNADRVIVEAVIGAEIGGWYIREAGIFDNTGALIAIAKFPETYKPILASGSGKDLYIKIILVVGNAATVNLSVDPQAVLATRQYVQDIHALHHSEANPHPQYVKRKSGLLYYYAQVTS